MKLPLFTKERREGVARLFDTLAVSAIVGATLGITGRTVISKYELLFLILFSMGAIVFSFVIRGEVK